MLLRRPLPARPRHHGGRYRAVGRARHGWRELLVLAALYLGYTASRLLAADDLGPALAHASQLVVLENAVGLGWEHTLNAWTYDSRALSIAAGGYYAAAHYVVTPTVMLWLWRTRRGDYPSARNALVLATTVALVVYITLPTAPPRFFSSFDDILAATADVGWWSGSASAPKGLGGLTNELAAMPSMHVGWALWCALALQRGTRRALRTLGWVHLLLTAFVVVATANHWTLDVLVGALVTATAWALTARRRPTLPHSHRR